MRSTNIVIFLACLNAAALVISAGLGPAFGIQPQIGGDQELQTAEQEGREQFQSSRGGVGEFVTATFMAVEFIGTIGSLVRAGPNMLISLGAPALLIRPFEAIVFIIISIDIAEVLSGRVLS